jgi:predicted transcriptional regulator
MMSTTIRVDSETHAQLVRLGEASGTSLMDTVRDATEALRRQRFAHQVVEQLTDLRRDGAAWADYLTDADATEVADGIGR